MPSSQNQGKLLGLVRSEINHDAANIPDSSLKSFIDFIQYDEDGKLALKALLDPQASFRNLSP